MPISDHGPEEIFLAAWSLMLASGLMTVPWYLDFSDATAPTLNALVCGGAVAVLSVLAMARTQIWLEHLVSVIAIWLCAAPWALGFEASEAATLSHVGFGLAILVSAGAELWRLREAAQGNSP